jgi:hypothetical protein
MRWPGKVHRVWSHKGVPHVMLDRFGEIGWGSNGGFQALNLAVQFGASRILLVGYDMNIMKGLHWHGRHGAGLSNPKQASVDKWRAQLDAQAPIFEQLGIEVLIASPHSALTAYRRVDLLEALSHGR